ncbi:cyclase family protein [Geodermatophilus sp. DSM 44513]|uniref:cyclase family protein n=1 Tax=Geodermatophilus sp. DSM 44513 TaxID=1528104 RepID=UPI001282CBE8|nr:cyclase family protein [Geodermatophilus sp. DSM 44513]WNV75085.1 cyclase family protein [Geodermatophilus sp. DSM 44513]
MAAADLAVLVGGLTVYDLEHERYIGAAIYPGHWPGFVYSLHRRHEVVQGQARTSASGLVTMAEHSGTHIDALCHQALDMELHGGVHVDATVQTPRGFTQLGVETIGPIMRRGVLLDVSGARGGAHLPVGYLVTGEDLQAAADAQGTAIRPGDCILVRTGWDQRFAEGDGYLAAAGVGADGARWLAARQPFLCGADNVAFDNPDIVDPELGLLPSHTVLIVHAGIYIVENLNLQGLAAAGCFEFLFVCLPLKMRGVTGSPVRPLALST